LTPSVSAPCSTVNFTRLPSVSLVESLSWCLTS
jgi:hypothetical protein